ncbi:hypothetical protein A9Q89_10960 [Gammaproteobacteria bacterium 53_120_T64]|nr:hypothetical protein A9Q89_10960 [Gammaproteobacteria bacterium 53_120_T64]
MTQDLLAALCLVLVIEGIMPFLAPSSWRNMLLTLAQSNEKYIRIMGLASLLLGAGLLFWVR